MAIWLDFGPSGGVGEGLGQMLHQFAGEFYDIGVASGQRKTFVGPEFAAHQSQRVGEGGLVLWIPGSLADGGRCLFGLLVGMERDQREQAEQGRGGAADRQLRPLALGLDAEVASRLFPCALTLRIGQFVPPRIGLPLWRASGRAASGRENCR